jgi:hypothetical protein
MTLQGPLRREMEEIRDLLGAGDAASTPQGAGESLRQFYARTATHWSQEVVRRWRERGEDGGQEAMGEKDLKREGFRLAEERCVRVCATKDHCIIVKHLVIICYCFIAV